MREHCDFCKLVYIVRPDHFGAPDENCIVRDGNQYDIHIEGADPYAGEYLENVKYYPYCGRKLVNNLMIKEDKNGRTRI